MGKKDIRYKWTREFTENEYQVYIDGEVHYMIESDFNTFRKNWQHAYNFVEI